VELHPSGYVKGNRERERFDFLSWAYALKRKKKRGESIDGKEAMQRVTGTDPLRSILWGHGITWALPSLRGESNELGGQLERRRASNVYHVQGRQSLWEDRLYSDGRG